MKIFNSFQTCRNIVRHYAPISRALSISDHAAEAVASSSTQFAATTSETSKDGIHSLYQLKKLQRSFNLSPDELKKINFLLRNSDFFSQVSNLTQSEVRTRVRASNLELTGLPHDIILLENKLNEQLSNVEILNFQLPLQIGTMLGFQSPRDIISKLETSSNVLVQLSYDHSSNNAIVQATGLNADIKALRKELQTMIDSVLSDSFTVPEYLLMTEDFSCLYKELNKLPNTIISVDHGLINVWTDDASNFARVQEDLDEFTKHSKQYNMESLTLRLVKEKYIFNILKYKPSGRVDINWKSYDGKTLIMEVKGRRSEVKKTITEVDTMKRQTQTITVALPTQCVENIGQLRGVIGRIGENLHVLKATIEDPTITITGRESPVNIALIRIYHELKNKISPEDFSKIDTSIFYTYLNHDELMYDEKNLQIFSATFPEAKIEWKKKLDGSIDVKIRSSPEDLRLMSYILKRNRIIPFSSFKNTADVSRIVSVLRQNGKLDEQVDIEVNADHIVIRTPQYDVQAAYDVIHDAIQNQGYQYKRYATNGRLLVPGNLLEEIRSAANAYEVLVAFSPDSTKDNELSIDIIGRAGNCDIFTTFLDMKFSSLTRLNQASANASSLASRFFQSYEKKENNAFVLHYADRNDFRIGGEPQAVDKMQNIVTDNFHTSCVSYDDENIEHHLLDQIERMKTEYPEVQISVDSDALEIQVTGGRADVKVVTDRISGIVSQCGIYEAIFDGHTFQNEDVRQRVLGTLLPNQSFTVADKVSSRLLSDDENKQVKLQLVGNKPSLRNLVDKLNTGGSMKREDRAMRYIELPDSGLYYLNYLQSKLGLPNVDFSKSLFGLHSFWTPQVKMNREWLWETIYTTPELRDNWTMAMIGNEKHFEEVENCIKNAVDGMNFHRIKLNIEDNFGLDALTNADFVQSAVADGEVKFFVEFYDEATNKCYVNVFGDDCERVEDLVTKIENFSSNGGKTVHIDAFNNANVDKDFPMKNCFYNSSVCEELDGLKEEVFHFYDPETHVITLAGDKDRISEFEIKVRDWLESVTERSKTYRDEDRIFLKAKIKLERHHEHCRQRWNRIAFSFGRKKGTILYAGARQDVEEFEEYLSKEVLRTLPTKSIGGRGRIIKALMSTLSVLYPGVFIKMNNTDITFCGENSEVEAAIELVKEATDNDAMENFFFKLRIEDREIEVPFADFSRVLVSVKFKQYWPELQCVIVGREINFRGPQKDINECSDILEKMVSWTVPDTAMRSATLFRDHRTRDGTFRDSHFIPPELLDKLFIDRAKGVQKSNQVKVYGRPEDILPLLYYLEEILPQKQLFRKDVPLTDLQGKFLRSEQGWREMYSHFEDTVAHSFSNDLGSVEIVGDSVHVSEVANNLERFISNQWAVYHVPRKFQMKYWSSRASDGARREFPRMLFDDMKMCVYGCRNDVGNIKEQWTENADGRYTGLKMTEKDVWKIDLGHLLH